MPCITGRGINFVVNLNEKLVKAATLRRRFYAQPLELSTRGRRVCCIWRQAVVAKQAHEVQQQVIIVASRNRLRSVRQTVWSYKSGDTY